MKNRFGFIPIVLPAIVMVLIIGAINLTNAPWVQAQQVQVPGDEVAPATTSNLRVPVDFTALDSAGNATTSENGGIQDTSDGDLTANTHLALDFGLASSSMLGVEATQNIVVGTQSKEMRIGYDHTSPIQEASDPGYTAETVRVSYRVAGSGNAGFILVPSNAGTQGGGGHDFLLEVGNNLIEFEVLYRYTDGTDEKYWTSRHRVNVTLPEGQDLEEFKFVKDTTDLDNAWYQYEEGIQIYRQGLAYGLIELPQAEGGSGNYTYRLLDISDDDAGVATLPDGMHIYDSDVRNIDRDLTTTTAVQVNGVDKLTLVNDASFDTQELTYSTTNGSITIADDNDFPFYLGGRPEMASANDIDYYFLRYEVEDTDTEKKIMIEFQVQVHRLPLDRPIVDERPDAAPYAMLASYIPLALGTCEPVADAEGTIKYTIPDLAVRYNPATEEYDVWVPATVDTVDLRVAVGMGVDVWMNRNKADSAYVRPFSTADNAEFAPNVVNDPAGRQAAVGTKIETKMREAYKAIELEETDEIHLWSVDLKASGVRGSVTEFTFRVVEGDDANEYVVNVNRTADTPAEFASGETDPLVYRFFQGAEVMHKLPEAVDGNDATSTWRYSILRSSQDTGIDPENFVGLELDSSTRVLSGTANPAGTGTSTPHKSTAEGLYRVQDGDCNDAISTVTESGRRVATKDSDELALEVHVYRDASLSTILVENGGVPAGETKTIDNDSIAKQYRPSAANEYTSRAYSYMAMGDDEAIEEYQYDVAVPAGATTTNVTLALTVDSSASGVSVGGKRAMAEGAAAGGMQRYATELGLMQGDNSVEVRVRNGQVIGVHMLNLRLSGPSVSDIAVMAGDMNLLTGDDAYDKFTFNYEVETYHEEVTVETMSLDQYPDAVVKVNGALETNVGAIKLDEGRNAITVSVTSGDDTQTYTIVVVREDNEAPTFPAGEPADMRFQVGKALPASLGMLPMATGGNGDLTYSISGLPAGLMLNDDEDQIVGTPEAPGPFEQDFTVTWKAEDADMDMIDDAAIAMFTITVTNAEVDYGTGPTDPTTPTAGPDALISLEVSYMASGQKMMAMLMPEFAFDTTDYTVNVPEEYETVYVSAIRKSVDAVIRIRNTELTGDLVEQDFSSSAIAGMSNMITITVDPAGDMVSPQDYTITVSTVGDDDASFAGADIADITAVAGTMVSETLPEATSGNAPFTYSLMDHNGDAVGAGLTFDASSRMLSGTAMLDMGTTKSVYMMTYMVKDADMDTDTIEFMLTVCEGDESGCTAGGGPTDTNPGSTPMNLMVNRASDGMSATMTWTPGSDASKQEVAAIDPADPQGSIVATAAELGSDVGTHTFSGLTNGVMYIYVVVGYDSEGNYKDADGNGYWEVYAEMSGN